MGKNVKHERDEGGGVNIENLNTMPGEDVKIITATYETNSEGVF